MGDFITIHLTDKGHNNLDNITSQRVSQPNLAPSGWGALGGVLPVGACGE